MPFATWWRGDPLPDLPPAPAFSAFRSTDRALIGRLNRLLAGQVGARFAAGSDVYLAALDGEPVGYGWVATRTGVIDELFFRFTVPPGNVYLWDFGTLPEYRGRGVYPRLLQAILHALPEVDRFWIGYADGNVASARGIEKAGFQVVGDFEIVSGRITGFIPLGSDERTEAAGKMLVPTAR